MVTKYDICTMASLACSGSAVQSFDEGTRESEIFSLYYDQAKRGELEDYPWNFLVNQARLTQTSGIPTTTNWKYIYAFPASCLNIINITNSAGYPQDYEIYGTEIYSNESELYAKYLIDVTEDQFPPYFIEVLVAKLVYEVAVPLVGSLDFKRAASQDYETKRKRARKLDADQQRIEPFIVTSNWLDAHGGW